jgi:hypothetical protein
MAFHFATPEGVPRLEAKVSGRVARRDALAIFVYVRIARYTPSIA